MIDFLSLQNNNENPTVMTILFTVLLSFVLASMIVFTYEKTSKSLSRPDNYIQALLLVAIVAATVIQAIGDSIARGLGMLGALSIIRFRTTLRDPRHIVFMFASLAAGIACGVFGFLVAIIGTVGFCLAAFLLSVSPFSHATNLIVKLEFEMPQDFEHMDEAKELLKKHCQKHELIRHRIVSNTTAALKANRPKQPQPGSETANSGPVYEGQVLRPSRLEYEYQLKVANEETGLKLVNELENLPGLERIRMVFRDTNVVV